MKILFYQHQYPAFGGIETVTTILANRFVKDGNRACIVSFKHKDGTDLLERLEAGVEWHELPESNLDSPANRAALMSILVSFNPDRIIFQDSYANIHTMLFAVIDEWRRNLKVHTITVEHSPLHIVDSDSSVAIKRNGVDVVKRIVISLLKPYFIFRRFLYESKRRKVLFDNSTKYVVLSKNYFPRIKRLVGKSRLQKLCAIPNPVIGQPPTSLTIKKNVVLFVGSLIPTKGVDTLLRIWKVIEHRHPDWRFVIVGDGSEHDKLAKIAKDAGLRHVSFEGFCKNPVPYYKEASIMVMASKFEGWPMVLGEAMKQGCVPVIFNSFASASDIVVDGTNGFMVKPFDCRCFVRKLELVISDSGMRNMMALAAIKKMDDYCLDAVVSQWYMLLNSMGSGAIVVVEHNSPFGVFTK